MAIQIVVIVVVIDRGDESPAFIPFVGMPIAPCYKGFGKRDEPKLKLIS